MIEKMEKLSLNRIVKNIKNKNMERKIIAEAEKGKLGRINVYHTGEYNREDIARQVVKCLNTAGYPVYIKEDSWDLGAMVGDGAFSPSVKIVQLDRPFRGWGPYGIRYGTVSINTGFAEVSHPGIRQALVDHFNSLEQKVN